jgi:hypothetical protein
MIRTFRTGKDGETSIRDIANGKPEFFGIRHPMVEKSFADYMKDHTLLPDGTRRAYTNWWAGWDKKVSMQSMLRHMEDLTAIEAGYIIFEIREEVKGEEMISKVYLRSIEEANDRVKEWKKSKSNFKWITGEECANAIKFNCNAYILDILK